jgi:DNA-binding NarL/FixJ family response regulator
VPSRSQIRILVVDHNPLMREGLALLVRLQTDMQLAGEAATAEDAVAMYCESRPEIVLLNLDLPARSAFNAIRGILACDRSACIIGLGTYREDDLWNQARTAGVRACAAKDDLSEILPNLIRAEYQRPSN